jgi:hypothetical protein
MMLKSIVEFMAGLGAATPAPATQTVTGKVVALLYYQVNQKKRGGGLDQSLGGARASVKWVGDPAGIVTSDGKAYQIVGGLTADNNAKVIELLGQTVTITGEVSEQHGMMVISAESATVVGK